MKYVKCFNGKIAEKKRVDAINGILSAFDVQVVPIVKEANHIEELCDTFVLKNISAEDTNQHLVCDCLEDLVGLAKTYPNIESEFYGANWTDDGLIYVAKLNDKGVWELL